MALFRRRRNEEPSSIAPAPATASSPAKNDGGEEVCLVPVSELKAVTRKARKRRTWTIFVLGGLFGLLLAALFAGKNDIHFSALSEFADQHWENFSNVLPAGILKDAKDLSVSLREQSHMVCYTHT